MRLRVRVCIVLGVMGAVTGCAVTTQPVKDSIAVQERTTQIRNATISSYHKTASAWRNHAFLNELVAVTGVPAERLVGPIQAFNGDVAVLNALYLQDVAARLHNAMVVTTFLDSKEGMYEKLSKQTAADTMQRVGDADMLMEELGDVANAVVTAMENPPKKNGGSTNGATAGGTSGAGDGTTTDGVSGTEPTDGENGGAGS